MGYDELVVAFRAMLQTAKSEEEEEDSIPFMPSQISAEDLQDYLKELFAAADENGDGVLQPTEMVNALELSGFNIPAGTILDVVAAADVNGDGVIDYDEFVPAVSELLQAQKQQAAPTDAPVVNWKDFAPEELDLYLKNLFKIAGENGDGVLQPNEYVKLMRLSGLKFPDETILEGFSKADTNGDGVLDQGELVAAFKAMMQTPDEEPKANKKKTKKTTKENKAAQPVDTEAALGDLQPQPSDFTDEELDEYLTQMFKVADENGDGVLQPTEMVTLLQLSGFNIPAGTILDMVAAADVNGDGVIDYEEFVPAVSELLQAQKQQAAPTDAPVVNWKDFAPEELDLYLKNLFKIADENGDGVLQ